jgi:hypothetical protein
VYDVTKGDKLGRGLSWFAATGSSGLNVGSQRKLHFCAIAAALRVQHFTTACMQSLFPRVTCGCHLAHCVSRFCAQCMLRALTKSSYNAWLEAVDLTGQHPRGWVVCHE